LLATDVHSLGFEEPVNHMPSTKEGRLESWHRQKCTMNGWYM